MTTRKSFIDGLIAGLYWIVSYWIIRILGHGMEASVAYATIVAWWFTAYMSAKLNLHISLIIPLFISYFLVFTILTIIGKPWLYRSIDFFSDISFSALLFFLKINLAQSFFICSPVIFDWLFQKLFISIRTKGRIVRNKFR